MDHQKRICIMATSLNKETMEIKSKPITIVLHKQIFDIMSTIRLACLDYVMSEKAALQDYQKKERFTWQDFLQYVPNDICRKHGFTKEAYPDETINVAMDEQLVCPTDLITSTKPETADDMYANLQASLTRKFDSLPTKEDKKLFTMICDMAGIKPHTPACNEAIGGLYLKMVRTCQEFKDDHRARPAVSYDEVYDALTEDMGAV